MFVDECRFFHLCISLDVSINENYSVKRGSTALGLSDLLYANTSSRIVCYRSSTSNPSRSHLVTVGALCSEMISSLTVSLSELSKWPAKPNMRNNARYYERLESSIYSHRNRLWVSEKMREFRRYKILSFQRKTCTLDDIFEGC
jgi:hypothetical protein